MIDITERGHDALKSLTFGGVPYDRLSRREKADLAILSYVWDNRELEGGPIDSIDNHAIVNSLRRRNPLWDYTDTHKLVEETVPKLVWSKLLERD